MPCRPIAFLSVCYMKLLRSCSPIFPCGRNKKRLSNREEATWKGEKGEKRLMCNAEDRIRASGCLVSVLPLVLETKTRGRRPSAGLYYVPPCQFDAIDNQTWPNFF